MKDKDIRAQTPPEAMREYWITKRGYEYWGIDPEHLQNPGMRQYIGFFIDAEILWGSTYGEMTHYVERRYQDFPDNYDEFVDQGLFPPFSLENGPTIGWRMVLAEEMMDAVQFALGEGLKWRPDEERMDVAIAYKLSDALKPLGLFVHHDQQNLGENQYTQGPWQRSADEEDRTFEAIDGKSYGDPMETPQFVYPEDRTSARDLMRAGKVAEELGIPHTYLEDPRGRGFVNTLVEARDFLKNLENAEEHGDIPSGLFPSASERVKAATKIVQVVIQLLETGFQDRTFDRKFTVKALNEGLSEYYGITITDPLQTHGFLHR